MKLLPPLLLMSALSTSAIGAEGAVAPVMVPIPAGKLTAPTCPDGTKVCDADDYVRRIVSIDAFDMATTEVTFDEWDACVRDGGCVKPASEWAYENRPVHAPCVENAVCQYPYDESWGRGKRPVIHVSWDDVQQYIGWLNKKTGSNYRLPTSTEWEYAARGGVATRYPWGKALGKNNANCDGCGSRWDNKQTAPVGSFKPNAFGLHDMAGNVSEWVSTCSQLDDTKTRCVRAIYRGGAWSYRAKSIDLGALADHFPTFRAPFLGFRLARSRAN